MDAAIVPVIIHLATFVVVIIFVIISQLMNVVSTLILIVLVKDNSHTCGVVQAFLCADSVILLFVFNIRPKVRDLLCKPEEFREVLVRNGTEHFFNVLLALRIEDTLGLDSCKHLVSCASQHIWCLVAERLLKTVQKHFVDCLRLCCSWTVNLHLRHIRAQHSLALVDVHLCLLGHHIFLFSLLLHSLLFLLLKFLNLLGLVILHQVTHLLIDPAAQGLGLACGLIL
mmetsp:Transcript_8553/g.20322  ORF Transcript_8553/g.20322 Transcript_8553/m.20322 type:complete len:227 (+) Transcript_8553:3152-3832(+)